MRSAPRLLCLCALPWGLPALAWLANLASSWIAATAVLAWLGSLPFTWVYLIRPAHQDRAELGEVQQQHAVLQALLHNAPTAIAAKDVDGRFVFCNPAFLALHAQSGTQLLGKTDHELLSLDVAEGFRASDLVAMAQKTTQRYRNTFVVDGAQQHVESLKYALQDAAGHTVGVGLIASDVTEDAAAERALRESQERFFTLFESSPVPMVYHVIRDGNRTFFRNEAFYTTFRFSREHSRNKSFGELGMWAHAQDSVQGRQNQLGGKPIDNWVVEMVRGDGSHGWFALYGRVLSDPTGVMFVTTLIDVTEPLRAREEVMALNSQLEDRVQERTQQLQSANEELSQTVQSLNETMDQLVQSEKLASLGALVAGMSHELNTPIGNGLTVASSLEHKTQEFAAQLVQGLRKSTLDQFIADTQFAADILVRNLAQAGALVSSFKSVAVDQTSAQRRLFSMQSVVSEIVLTLHPAIRKSGCVVTQDIEPNLELDSYPGAFGQVLSNLINNAIIHGLKPAEAGGIRITARRTSGHHAEVAVHNTGTPIDPAHLKRIFDPFFTTRMGQGGSGLGLHIVHTLVTGLLGGKVTVTSTEALGTEFVVQLPLRAPTASVSG